MKARSALLVLSLAAACGSKPKSLPKLSEQVSTVADDKALLAIDAPPPKVLVLIAPDGTLAVADAPKGPDAWNVLSTKPPRNRGQPIHREVIGPMLHEALALGIAIEPRAKDMKGEPIVDMAVLEDTKPADFNDDPPPPPEEEEEDDESGGTGTAMALEEGKMGKRDADRAAGQYKMKKNTDDPQLARQQAIEAARSAGILAQVGARGGSGMSGGFGFGRSGFGPGSDDVNSEMPSHVTKAVGRRAFPDDDEPTTLIVAAPAAKAAPVVDLLAELRSTYVAVNHQGQLRALRVGYGQRTGDASWTEAGERWVEVRIGPDALTIEAVPSPSSTVAWATGPLDVAGLTKAYTAARDTIGGDARLDVDVLVGPDTDMQRLVDVLAALDGAGAQVIALGDLPAADELAKRGKTIVRAVLGQPQSVGDLDKAIIRRYIKAELPKIKACYEQALLVNPSLTGTVSTQFFITPSGAVAVANASGLDPEVASCVAAIIKAIEFPQPKGGGGVQVNYPFTFRN